MQREENRSPQTHPPRDSRSSEERIPLYFWEGASHQTDKGGWWVRALSEELASKCVKCKRTWPILQVDKEDCINCKVGKHTGNRSRQRKRRLDPSSNRVGRRDAFCSSGRNRKNILSQSHLGLHSHTASYSALSGGPDAIDGYISD